MPSDKRARQRALRDQKMAVQERHDRRMKLGRRGVGLVVVVGIVIGMVVLLSGGSKPKTAAKSTTTTSAVTTTTVAATTTTVPDAIAPTCPPATAAGSPVRRTAFTKAPPLCIAKTAVFDATVKTDIGTFVIRMNAAASLAAVNNFVFLARYHFYNGVSFQRVIPGFMVQGGDANGTGGPGYSFTGTTPPSACTAKLDCYAIGAVALANSSGPTTNGSQFFIVTGKEGEELPASYTMVGQVISGISVVQKIDAGGDAADDGTPPKVLHHMISVTVTEVAA